VGQVTKKDFVPYSERKALESQLFKDRLTSDESAPSLGTSDAASTGDGDEVMPLPSGKQLVDLLPL
jgi:hypothetical protein